MAELENDSVYGGGMKALFIRPDNGVNNNIFGATQESVHTVVWVRAIDETVDKVRVDDPSWLRATQCQGQLIGLRWLFGGES